MTKLKNKKTRRLTKAKDVMEEQVASWSMMWCVLGLLLELCDKDTCEHVHKTSLAIYYYSRSSSVLGTKRKQFASFKIQVCFYSNK